MSYAFPFAFNFQMFCSMPSSQPDLPTRIHSPSCTSLSSSSVPSSKSPRPSSSSNLSSTATPVPLVPSDQTSYPRSRSYDRRFKSASLSINPPPRATSLPASSYRPHVKAKDRLSKWSSPYAVSSKMASHSRLPKALVDHSDSVVLDGLAPNTKTSYAEGLLRFHQFCDDWHISESDRMPASTDLLAAFASSFVGFYSSTTISLWLSGLRCWHIINRAPWHGDNERIHLIRRAADRHGSLIR